MAYEANETITDLIEQVCKEDKKEIDHLKEAYEVYEFGEQNITQYSDLRQVVRDLAESSYLGESSYTRKLTHENVTPLCTWALDEKSFSFENIKNIEGQEIPPAELQKIEKDLRSRIDPIDLSQFFTQLLVTGLAITSVGLNDEFYVPISEDVEYDYESRKYIIINRELDPEIVQQIIENDLWMSDDYDENGEKNIDTIPETHEGPLEIKHGQVRNGRDEWVEFIEYNSNYYYRIHDRPVIRAQVFAVDPKTYMPKGIYSLCYAEEHYAIDLFAAIKSRIQKAISASLLVASNTLDAADVDTLYSGAVGAFNPDVLEGADQNPFIFAPSRVDEIKHYERLLERIEEKIRRITGLYMRQTEISGSDTSATEAENVFVNSHERHREIINQFTKTYAECLRFLAFRDYGLVLDIRINNNPLDDNLRQIGSEKLMGMTIKAIESDPSGEKFGGLLNPAVLKSSLDDFFNFYKLDKSVLPTPQETALTNQTKMQEAQQQEREAAQRLADAEISKAEAEKMKGEAELLKAQHKFMELMFNKGKHQDEMAFNMAELMQEAKKNNDDKAFDMFKSIYDSQVKNQMEVNKQIASANKGADNAKPNK